MNRELQYAFDCEPVTVVGKATQWDPPLRRLQPELEGPSRLVVKRAYLSQVHFRLWGEWPSERELGRLL